MTSPLINVGGRVVAAIDPSLHAARVAAHAAWAASRLAAPLELLHAIERNAAPVAHDLSGNLTLGSQEALLAQLAALDEQRGRLSQEHGRMLLESARADVAASHGIEAQVRQRHGTLADALLDLEADTRLFVLGKRGEHADGDSGQVRGELGGQVEQVIRAVHRPVLLVAGASRPVRRFLIAYDGSATSRRCIELVCASPLLKGLECEVLTVGPASAAAARHLDWAREQLQSAGFDARVRIVDGVPEAMIADHIVDRAIDLLVMGAYGHSRLRSLIVGSTTTQLLRASPVPVLLLR